MRRYAYPVACMLLLAGSLLAAPPQWFASGRHHRYPSEFYFIGLGSGDSYLSAMEQAQGQIARQIEVRVESEMTTLVSSYSVDDRETVTARFESELKSTAEASLRGVEVGEKTVADGLHYVLLALDRQQYAEGLRGELDRLRESIGDILADSDSLLSKGRVFPALELMMTSGEPATELEAKAALYASLTGETYPLSGLLSGPALLSRVRTTLSRLKLEKMSGDDQRGRSGRPLSEPLVVRVIYSPNGETIPVANAALALKDEEGNVVERGVTGDDGSASFQASAIGVDMGKATVAFDLARVSNLFRRDLKRLEAVFRYDVVTMGPLKFTVEIFDEKGARMPEVEIRMAASVTSLGHRVAADAPLLLTGKVVQVESHEVDGVSGRQYLVRSELTLFMEARAGKEKLASVTLTSTGLDKASERAAAENCYKGFDISRTQMSMMIGQGGDRLREIALEQSRVALEDAKTLCSQGRLREALDRLPDVVEGDEYVGGKVKLMEEIKATLSEKD